MQIPKFWTKSHGNSSNGYLLTTLNLRGRLTVDHLSELYCNHRDWKRYSKKQLLALFIQKKLKLPSLENSFPTTSYRSTYYEKKYIYYNSPEGISLTDLVGRWWLPRAVLPPGPTNRRKPSSETYICSNICQRREHPRLPVKYLSEKQPVARQSKNNHVLITFFFSLFWAGWDLEKWKITPHLPMHTD